MERSVATLVGTQQAIGLILWSCWWWVI